MVNVNPINSRSLPIQTSSLSQFTKTLSSKRETSSGTVFELPVPPPIAEPKEIATNCRPENPQTLYGLPVPPPIAEPKEITSYGPENLQKLYPSSEEVLPEFKTGPGRIAAPPKNEIVIIYENGKIICGGSETRPKPPILEAHPEKLTPPMPLPLEARNNINKLSTRDFFDFGYMRDFLPDVLSYMDLKDLDDSHK